jgi:hypothetical protein
MIKIFFVFILCAAFLSSCSKTSNPASVTTPVDTTALINNSLFEVGGNFSLNGWMFHPAQADDTLDFEMDTPPGKGTWSFKLHTSDLLGANNSISQSFTNLSSGVYSLTSWLKYKYILAAGTFPPGWISIIKTSAGVSTPKIQLGVDSTNWTQETLLDTLQLISTDTVTVSLSAGARSVSSNLHGNPMWVDDITFRKLP